MTCNKGIQKLVFRSDKQLEHDLEKICGCYTIAKQLDHIYAGEKRWFEKDSKSFYDSERTKKLVISLRNN